MTYRKPTNKSKCCEEKENYLNKKELWRLSNDANAR